MPLDFITAVETGGRQAAAALEQQRTGAIPWSDDWTVQECAQHLGGVHHVVAKVIAGRPTTDFGAFGSLSPPAATDPALGDWLREGTAAVVEQLRSTDPDAECWTWWPGATTVAFWQRRMAQETLVHAWDAESGAGATTPMDPELAADGIDEYLDVMLAMTRRRHSAPGAGETVHVHCTDAAGEWLVRFPSEGTRELTREHAKGDVAFRGPAQGLLLFLYGRLDADAAGVEIVGDESLAARRRELLPAV